MNRRDALKRMGAAALGAVVASSGLLSLTGCNESEKKRTILYFTGTGNSLYIARQLAGEKGEIVSIPQLMKQKQFNIEADEVGIVYPIYGHMPPNMVREFIKRAKIKATYKFAVLTYGNRKCNAVEIWNDISQQAGTKFDYISTIVMVDNWLPNFDMNEQVKVDKHIPEHLTSIKKDIDQQRNWIEPVSDIERSQHQEFLERTGNLAGESFIMDSAKSFLITDACIGCGICTEVCPRGNYELTSQGTTMKGECEFCLACIQNCPQKAIQFAKQGDGTWPHWPEKNPNARYRNEHVSINDIKTANNQKG